MAGHAARRELPGIGQAGPGLAAMVVVLAALAAGSGAGASGLPPLGCVPLPIWVYPQTAASDPGRPPEVLSWRHQILEQAQYEELARQWEAYATGHPRDARALVEWGDALRYSGRYEEGVERYAQAFAVDSSNAAAVAAHCLQFIHSEKDQVWMRAHQSLLQAAGGDPQCTDVYYTLWATSLRSGDEALAAECLRRLVALGDMPRPLLEWGRNMVAGAPPGAVILTNGDNDTYPPLAYQTITGDRPDVAIVNLSLLNTSWYIRHWRDRGALITLTDEQIDALQPRRDAKIADQVQQHMLANSRRAVGGRPLCYAVTVYESNIATDAPLMLEGLLRRVEPGGAPSPKAGLEEGPVDLERTRELIDTVYLFDGARDPFVDWKREQAVGSLCLNYAALLGQVGAWLLETQRAGDAGPYLYRAIEIMAAHSGTDKCGGLIDAWQQADPHSALLARARELAAGKNRDR
jgi:tetratricopeptide (TPR) repeat protein